MKAKCNQCAEVFSGLEDFDHHRPGKPGTKRPCLTQEQMTELGWIHENQRWHRPGFSERRQHMAKAFGRSSHG